MPGERISPNTIVRSSRTTKVPFGETFGVPSGAAVATNPRRCSSITRFMSGVTILGSSQIPLDLITSSGFEARNISERNRHRMGRTTTPLHWSRPGRPVYPRTPVLVATALSGRHLHSWSGGGLHLAAPPKDRRAYLKTLPESAHQLGLEHCLELVCGRSCEVRPSAKFDPNRPRLRDYHFMGQEA